MEACIPIYTAADWGYRAPLRVMLESLHDHTPADSRVQRVVVLTDGASVGKYFEEVYCLPRLGIEFRSVDPSRLSSLPVYGHVGLMTYVRLLMESLEVCPEDRVLYLDADILVRKQLAPLFETITAQLCAVSAVREMGTYTVAGRGGVFDWAERGLSPSQPYFNAGVLGLDMERVRSTRAFSRALEYLISNGRNVLSWDQGALNAILGSDTQLMPLIWNFTSSALFRSSGAEGEQRPKLCDVAIAHFTGSGASKPWHINSTSPFYSEYRRYWDLTGAALAENTRLEKIVGVTPAHYVRRAMVMLKYLPSYRFGIRQTNFSE